MDTDLIYKDRKAVNIKKFDFESINNSKYSSELTSDNYNNNKYSDDNISDYNGN